MNFEFSDDQLVMKEEVRKLFEKEDSVKRNRNILEGEENFDKDLWNKVVEMGLTAITIPEEHGGIGLGFLELCVVAEEMGRAIAPIPYSSSAYLATTAIINSSNDDVKKEYLPKLAAGEMIGTFAHSEELGTPTSDNAKTTFQNGKLSGDKIAVPDGDIANLFVVSAKCGDKVGLFLVDADSKGVEVSKAECFDGSRSYANISFKDVDAKIIEDSSSEAIDKLLNQAAVLFAFEQVGGAEASMNMAKEYAMGRYAFGRQIGSFQAIKHKLADMYISLTLARSNCYFGAWALGNDAPELPVAAATARVSATKAFYECSKENIQTHGGMGATWEFDCHLFYRRARLLSANIGGQSLWKDKLVSSIERSNLPQ